MVLVGLAHILIEAKVFKEVVALKDCVMLDHPVVRFTHVRLEQNSGNICMVRRTKRVANVVQQSTDDVLLVFTILMSERCCL